MVWGVVMVYYLDLLLLVNWGLNFLLIVLTGWVGGQPFNWRRYGSAALAGAVVWLIYFFAPQYILISWLCRLAGGLAISFIAWPGAGWRRLFSKCALLVITGQLMGGAVYGLAFFLDATPLGAQGFPLALVAGGGAVALPMGAWLAGRVQRTKSLSAYLGRVAISWAGKTVSLPALLDSGNTLRNPFNRWPVVILEQSAASDLLDNETLEWLSEPTTTPPQTIARKVAVIPFTSLAGTGLLGAVQPDSVVIYGEQGSLALTRVYVALHNNGPGMQEYKAIAFPIKHQQKGCQE